MSVFSPLHITRKLSRSHLQAEGNIMFWGLFVCLLFPLFSAFLVLPTQQYSPISSYSHFPPPISLHGLQPKEQGYCNRIYTLVQGDTQPFGSHQDPSQCFEETVWAIWSINSVLCGRFQHREENPLPEHLPHPSQGRRTFYMRLDPKAAKALSHYSYSFGINPC